MSELESTLQDAIESGARIEPDEILAIASDAGRLVLENGGETYRAEEMMTLVSDALGATHSEAFVTPTVVLLGITDIKGTHRTCLHRVKSRGVNLSRLINLNRLSRKLARDSYGKVTNPKEVQFVLSRIRNSSTHKNWAVVLSAALSAFFFSFVFKGSIFDSVLAFCVAGFLQVLLFKLEKYSLNAFIKSIITAFFVSFCTRFLAFWGLVAEPSIATISVLMILVPGLSIVNAIRDTIAGDLVAGVARAAEAFIIAAALSIGAGLGHILIERLLFPFSALSFEALKNFVASHSVEFLGVVVCNEWVFAIFSSICAGFAAGCFAFLFFARVSDVKSAIFCGFLGWALYSVFVICGYSEMFSYAVASFAIGIFAELGSVYFKQPATVGIAPAIIPLVPGGGMYKTMLAVIDGSLSSALEIGFSTLCIAGSIAVGLAIASSFLRLSHKIHFANKIVVKKNKSDKI